MSKLRVLCGYEMSGINREAFRQLGWDAWSCDLKETIQPGQHITGDITEALSQHWDLAIFNPPCTYTAFSGFHHCKNNPHRLRLAYHGLAEIIWLYNLPIKHIAIENSLSYFIEENWRPPDQKFQPYHFNTPLKKQINIWLKNLPLLIPTNITAPGKRFPFINSVPDTKKQAEIRSTSFPEVARPMAEQWTDYITTGTVSQKLNF